MPEHIALMPGPEGRTPRLYEVERGHKTESYIVAVSGRPLIGDEVKQQQQSLTAGATVDSDTKASDAVRFLPQPQPEPIQFTGLTLAELEQYRNDPFWRSLRLFMFVLFWLLWLLMFIGAIFIVAVSPGCTAKQHPSWWQTAISYQIWLPSFRDSDGDGIGDIVGLTDRLEKLRKIGIQTVWPTPLFSSDNFSLVVRNHTEIDAQLGTNSQFDSLIAQVHAKEMYLIIDLPIAITSREHAWFYHSARASIHADYADFYHWRRQSGNPKFWSEERDTGSYYLHHEDQPDWPVLNWQSNAIRTRMFAIFSHWIEKGIDGFNLPHIQYLARTADGARPDWPTIYDTLRDIRNHVDVYKNETEATKLKKIILFSSLDSATESDKLALTNSVNLLDSVVNYELGNVQINGRVCSASSANDTVAACVHEILSDVLRFYNLYPNMVPMWEFGNPYLNRLSSRLKSRTHAELLTMVQLLLPGTNNFYYGEEIGMRNLDGNESYPQRGAMQWNDDDNGGFSSSSSSVVRLHSDYKNINFEKQYHDAPSQLKMFSKLAKLRRRDETLMQGHTSIGNLVQHGFTLSRFQHHEHNSTYGNVYVAAVNLGRSDLRLPLGDIPTIWTKKTTSAQVIAISSNVVDYKLRQTIDISEKVVHVGAEQGIVLRFI